MRDDFLIFGAPDIHDDEIDEVVDTLKSGWLGTGPKTQKFEEQFKRYKNINYALALNSCTAALHLSCMLCELEEGDEVITTPLTFCATANVIAHVGAKPVFVDVEPDTGCIDPLLIEDYITDDTKAILPVHLYGRMCNMDALMKIKGDYKLKLIEDAAHAVEATYHNQHAGTFGDFGCFSFYSTKNVVTGEGGMLISNHKKEMERARILSLHGMTKDAWKRFEKVEYKHYQIVEDGYKYNMMDIQAALGIHQLQRVEENWKRRLEIWSKYTQAFADLPCITPAPFEDNTKHGLHLYNILLEEHDRDETLKKFKKENIGTGVHYIALHLQPFYQRKYGYHRGDFLNAEYISDRTISLPFSSKLTDKDVSDVIDTVKKVLS